MADKRSALIIATYQYEDAGLNRLFAPAQDAESLNRVLGDPKIGNFKVRTLLNEKSHQVRAEIEAFFADRKRDDLLLLYFSGHGIKNEAGQLHYATIDTRRKLLRSTAIAANFVNEIMLSSRSRCQVLLLDCCFSGAFARGMVAKADTIIGTQEYFGGRGRIVLTASDALQYAFEEDEIKGEGTHSVFTTCLVEGLETGEADINRDGLISIDELYDYVYDRVLDKTPEQKPGKWSLDVQGEIIIAKNPYPVSVLSQPVLQQTVASDVTLGKYNTPASSRNPQLVLFMVDCGYHMNKQIAGQSAIEVVTTALQRAAIRMVQRSTRGTIVAPRYHIGFIAYSSQTFDLSGGIQPLDSLANKGIPRLRVLKEPANTYNAFYTLHKLLQANMGKYKECPAPLIIHITAGEYTGRDPIPIANQIKNLCVIDGNVLIVNLLIDDETILNPMNDIMSWPGIIDENQLLKSHARELCRMSSIIPESYRNVAHEYGYKGLQRNSRMLYPGTQPEMVELGVSVASATPVSHP